MELLPLAFFVHQPRRIEDLYGPRPLEAYTPYRVRKTVVLSQMGYENFITDMLADRDYLEDRALEGQRQEAVWDCILVKARTGSAGVLVVPDGPYTEWAALAPARAGESSDAL